MSDMRLTRRGALYAGAAGAVGLWAAACGGSSSGSSAGGGSGATAAGGNINWLTWSDHYLPAQIKAVKSETNIAASPTLFSDDSEGYLKIKQTGGQFTIASIDALWAPKFHDDGLTQPFDMSEIGATKELYPNAQNFSFFQADGQAIGYPFAWSTIQIYYNPANVTTTPDSFHALLDPKYKAKIVVENQPTDLMAMAGHRDRRERSVQPDHRRDQQGEGLPHPAQAEHPQAGVAEHGVDLRADRRLGLDRAREPRHRVPREGRGRADLIKAAYPSEGSYGFIDCEQIVKSSSDSSLFVPFIDKMERAHWIAQNFITNGRPLFNEKAYALLVNQGQKERADALLYNKPDKAEQMTLKGPSGNTQAVTDAFNEVFGA